MTDKRYDLRMPDGCLPGHTVACITVSEANTIATRCANIKREAERITAAENYLAGHKACGIHTGDIVKVFRTATSHENGWNNLWAYDMDEWVGLECRVLTDEGACGFRMVRSHENLNKRYLPYFVLEKVPAEQPESRTWRNWDIVLSAGSNRSFIFDEGDWHSIMGTGTCDPDWRTTIEGFYLGNLKEWLEEGIIHLFLNERELTRCQLQLGEHSDEPGDQLWHKVSHALDAWRQLRRLCVENAEQKVQPHV